MVLIYALSVIPADPTYETGFRFLTDLNPSIQNLLHIPAYALLTLLYLRYCFCFPLTTPRIILYCLAVLMPFGILNEVAQSFVIGRYGSLIDICLNITGILAGLWIGIRFRSRIT